MHTVEFTCTCRVWLKDPRLDICHTSVFFRSNCNVESGLSGRNVGTYISSCLSCDRTRLKKLTSKSGRMEIILSYEIWASEILCVTSRFCVFKTLNCYRSVPAGCFFQSQKKMTEICCLWKTIKLYHDRKNN